MTDKDEGAFDPARWTRGEGARLSSAEWAGVALSVLWIVAVVVQALRAPEAGGPLGIVMTVLVAILPPALIWAAAMTLRSVQALRAEAARLQAAVDAMRAAQQQGGAGLKPSVEKKIDEIAQAARHTESVLSRMATRPAAGPAAAVARPRPAPEAEDQPALALGAPGEEAQAPLANEDFIRALQFPENPDDGEGFRALRAALADREVARLIRAAQDVLTLLSQEGIYMDDLAPDRARPELWRRFAAGERGRGVAAVGGVRDRASLALTAARMREDPVFRDAGHHFLRTFDRALQGFERGATDAEIAEMADTRTARAFMLFGRVMGVFD